MAGAVFSHRLLDLVVHVPDLPLLGDSFKVGFGLWRQVWIGFPLEIALLVAAAWAYARGVPSASRWGDVWLWIFVALLTAVQAYGAFGPPSLRPGRGAHGHRRLSDAGRPGGGGRPGARNGREPDGHAVTTS